MQDTLETMRRVGYTKLRIMLGGIRVLLFPMRIVVSDPLPSLADVVEAIQRADTVQGNR